MAKPLNQKPIQLRENHRRSISVSLHLLDKGLCEWEQFVSGQVAGGVMYQPQDTLSPASKKELRARIRRIRESIVRLRDDLKLAPARPRTTSLIVGQATILWEMLAELNSSSLHGYGTVSPQFAAYIDPVGESLTQQMHEISALFCRPTRDRET